MARNRKLTGASRLAVTVGLAVSSLALFAPVASATSVGVPGKPTAGVGGHGRVNLTWAHPAAAVTGYKVRVSTSASGPWSVPTSCGGVVVKNSCSVTGLVNNKKYFFKVLAVKGTASGAFSPVSAPITLTCANGSACAVGNRGPGGGVVFYTAAAPFDTAGDVYLEFADPGAWYDYASDHGYQGAPGVIDPSIQWCPSTPSPVTWIALGKGLGNTLTLTQCAGDRAAHAAHGYTGGGKTNWFLPNRSEANLLCQYASGVAAPSVNATCAGSDTPRGGFTPDLYWSSSSMNASDVLVPLAAEASTPVPCLTGQPALSAANCAIILGGIAPAIAVNFSHNYPAGNTKAIKSCTGGISPVLQVPAAAGLPGSTPHDGPLYYHCLRAQTGSVASPQVRPVRAFK